MPTISGSLGLGAVIKGSAPDSKNILAQIRGCYAPSVIDFFLDSEEYTAASNNAWADVVDYYRPIDTNNTYFSINGTVVSGTFTPITVSGVTASGVAYRMSYDPSDDFSSLSGPTEFSVRVQNDWGCWIEEHYSLTFGYKIDFENQNYRYIDFGYQKQVVVRVLVENAASCPRESGNAYWFETKQPFNKDLSCSIIGVPGPSTDGLPAQINAITSAYYYGRTMELTVRARDFSGNEMEFVLEYTIEEEP